MSSRQLAMVIDLNKCIGCQTCTVACKTEWTNRDGREYMYWNNVETYPGSGYPKDWMNSGGGYDQFGYLNEGVIPKEEDYGVPWEYNHDAIMSSDFTSEERAHITQKSEPKWGVNWDEDVGDGQFPNDNYFFYIPRICNHCSEPSCLSACPREAIFKRDEDGVVLVDLDKCEGYKFCIAGCPYKKIYFNPKISKSEKCNLCFPRIEQGLPPACAQQCSGRTRFVGFLDDEEGQVYKLVNKYKVALGLRDDWGTEPNVYYIPPTEAPVKYDAFGKIIEDSNRIPYDELVTLFGDGVKDAIQTIKSEKKKKKEGEQSELMDILIAYNHSEMFRLDANYYADIANSRGSKSLLRVDSRYDQGKYTKKILTFKEQL